MSPTAKARFVRDLRTTLICLAFAFVVAAGTYYYVQRASDRFDAARHHSDKQFAKALIVTDRKFRQALKIQTSLFAYSTNKSVCGFRDLAKGTLKGAIAGEHDQRLPLAIRQRNHAIVVRTNRFLTTQVTVPSDFDCKTLPKKPPKTLPRNP